MSLSWISKRLQKKVIDEVSRQLNIDISPDGKVDFKPLQPTKPLKKCQFCQEIIPLEDVFCPKCNKALK